MVDLKVDLLLKDELFYELKLRNQTPSEQSTVTDLRKLLRQCIKQNVPAVASNLINKISIKEEIETISNKLDLIEERQIELTGDSRAIDLGRQNARINHCCLRINSLTHLSLGEDEKNDWLKLSERYKQLKDKFNALQFDQVAIEQSVRKLSESYIEEEELDEVFGKLNLNITETKQVPSVSNPNPDLGQVGLSRFGQSIPTQETHSSTSVPFDPNLYQKLPNPLEVHLRSLKVCNGLVINQLIEFLRVIYKVKKETSLLDSQIIDVFISKTENPMQDILLNFKSQGLDTLKKELLRNFVPISTKENLIRTHVSKPQDVKEPLNMYVNRVKEYSQLLDCTYDESELVELITIGLNPRCRINISGLGQIRTLKEFELACIHNQNVEASNSLRNTESPREYSKPYVNNLGQHHNQRTPHTTKTCFSCGRVGHLARNCYRKPKN